MSFYSKEKKALNNLLRRGITEHMKHKIGTNTCMVYLRVVIPFVQPWNFLILALIKKKYLRGFRLFLVGQDVQVDLVDPEKNRQRCN